MSILDWARNAEPGECLAYHVGNLAADRVNDPRLDREARMALKLAEEGFAVLTQWRETPTACGYLITRTEELL